ncbi:hypothetical protein [Pantoea coffeiphila]|uniref:Uncharacterized protein n=1 Tax=Pantoea coffeiphila TaxID=1465635 RepID=A0A2S9I5P9_9GAMM|nr:hypothetical protein [Pantoea coffeiphila]PRD13127.1 hypothetical protein CQW29_22915 [Pantoea coffeiphila]
MPEKKYCYRYVDRHDSEGRAVIELDQCVILRETEKTFWYCWDLPYMTLEQLQVYRSRPGDRSVKRCLKGASRSNYHMTREEALAAFTYRKSFQLSRIKLTLEKVSLCLAALSRAGHVEGLEVVDGEVLAYSRTVISVPDCTIIGEKGPEAENYSWGEY